MKIAAIIPTFKRAGKLRDFIQNHNESSTNSKLYFVVEPSDQETIDLLTELKESHFIHEGEYVSAINYGFNHTKEDFVLCAADDVVFTRGWDEKLLALADAHEDKHIFGGIDEWVISMTQKHISHPLVRRSHFVYQPSLYNSQYIHYLCDIEFVQRGFKEDCVMITPEVLIGHPHTVTEHLVKEEWDETYKRSFSKIKRDSDLYHRRKGEFEMWDFTELNRGYAIPTKLNPIYNETLISIVIPSYKDYDLIKRCLQSIVNNTFYRFELIIINDSVVEEIHASPWEVVNYRKFLDSIVLEDQSCDIRVVHNEKQEWINHNWNLGAKMARGNYVAFLNSDITLSKDWDKYLIAVLNRPGRKFTVACPFETNPHTRKAFSLDKLFKKYAPHMIKGPCFLMSKEDVDKIFPIPEQLKHWCGDSYIADKAEKMGGTIFAKKAIIHHLISQSSRKVPSLELQKRTYEDIIEYEKISGRNMDFIKSRFPLSIRGFYSADAGK